jgi:sulfur-oxidizing protein SoxY
MKRRTLLKGTLGAAVVGVAASAGLLTPQAVFAGAWPKGAFNAKSVDDAVKGLFKDASMANSGSIKIKAPPIAENGAEVGITVSSSLPKTDSLSILIEKNAQPLAANFSLPAGTDAFVRTRVKIAKTSNVHAVARSNGKLFVAKREVKVTIGGCGG